MCDLQWTIINIIIILSQTNLHTNLILYHQIILQRPLKWDNSERRLLVISLLTVFLSRGAKTWILPQQNDLPNIEPVFWCNIFSFTDIAICTDWVQRYHIIPTISQKGNDPQRKVSRSEKHGVRISLYTQKIFTLKCGMHTKQSKISFIGKNIKLDLI